jgi:hypothetical protein
MKIEEIKRKALDFLREIYPEVSEKALLEDMLSYVGPKEAYLRPILIARDPEHAVGTLIHEIVEAQEIKKIAGRVITLLSPDWEEFYAKAHPIACEIEASYYQRVGREKLRSEALRRKGAPKP